MASLAFTSTPSESRRCQVPGGWSGVKLAAAPSDRAGRSADPPRPHLHCGHISARGCAQQVSLQLLGMRRCAGPLLLLLGWCHLVRLLLLTRCLHAQPPKSRSRNRPVRACGGWGEQGQRRLSAPFSLTSARLHLALDCRAVLRRRRFGRCADETCGLGFTCACPKSTYIRT